MANEVALDKVHVRFSLPVERLVQMQKSYPEFKRRSDLINHALYIAYGAVPLTRADLKRIEAMKRENLRKRLEARAKKKAAKSAK